MVDAEKHKSESKADDGIKPIKSTISADFDDNKAFALASVYSHEIKTYVADNFKKEITDLDVLNFALMLCDRIVTADSDDEVAETLKEVTEIITNKYKLNEFIFTNLAVIKSWNETTDALYDKKYDVTEKEFNDLMKKNNEKNQYKAWNDERKILDAYSSKFAKGGADNGEC